MFLLYGSLSRCSKRNRQAGRRLLAFSQSISYNRSDYKICSILFGIQMSEKRGNMLTYSFENITVPLYEYIYQSIKKDILSGVIRPGEKLPSKRTFAKNNGISTITIQNAYEQLVSEGYIYAIEKKGYYASELHNLSALPKESGVRYDIKLPSASNYTYDLSGNQINPDNFPFSVWAKLSREVISGKKEELMSISHMAGIYELRKAIADHLQSFRGMLVDPDQILVGAGTEYLYGILVQLLGSDKIYAIEDPGYKKLIKIYNQYRVNPVYAELDEKGLTVSGIKAAGAQVAHICPNHHFPTGITMPASRRYEMLAWANESQKHYIIEDDYDSEFRYNGKPIPTLFSIDTYEKVIYMNTFSKSLSPTIRVSYVVLPVHLANAMYEKLGFLSCTVSNFEQYTLAAFIGQGYFEKHINRMRLYYQKQHRSVREMIAESSLKNRCEIIENDAGLHFILKLRTELPDRVIKQMLMEQGIHMNAVSEYSLTEQTAEQHLFVLNYTNIETESLKNILDCIDSALSHREKTFDSYSEEERKDLI